MANHSISWVLSAHMHFGDLDFTVTVRGELALAHLAIQSLPSIGSGYRRLERQPGASLGPQPSRVDPRRLTLSPEHPTWSTPIVLLFGLCNTTATVSHLVAQRMIPPPTNNEFMGVIEHITESIHDLLAEEPGSPSGSNSSGGSQHPSLNASWQVPLRGTSKASTRGRLLQQMTSVMRSRGRQRSHPTC